MTDKLTTRQVEQLEFALGRGEKIEAIKLYREFTGEGLKQSKEVIEQLSDELFRRDPGAYAKLAPRAAGCASVIAVVLVLAAATMGAWVWRAASL